MNKIQRFFVLVFAVGLFLALSGLSFRYMESKRASVSNNAVSVSSAETAVSQGEEEVPQDNNTEEAAVVEEPQDVPEMEAPAQEKPETAPKAETVSAQQQKQTVVAKVTKPQETAVKPAVKIASRGTSPAPSKKGDSIVSAAKQYLGRPYVYGASGPDTFDCSGLTMYVYNKFGVSLPHSSKAQSSMGQYVAKDKLQPGDLVFFTTDGSGQISHVGIYAGGGSFVNAPRTGANVRIDTMSSGYYAARYITARRIIF